MKVTNNNNFIRVNNNQYNPFNGIYVSNDKWEENHSSIYRGFTLSNESEYQGIIFIVTTNCNLNCQYCYSKSDSKKDLNINTAKKFIDYFINKGKQKFIVNFFGGEPTLRMEFIKEVVQYFKIRDNIEVLYRINTNGTFKKEVFDYLVENKFIVIISSDGEPAKKNDLRSNYYVLKKVEENIIKLANTNVTFRTRATVSKKNIKQLEKNIRYWKNLGIRFINLEPVNPYGKNLNGSDLVPNTNDYVFYLMNAISEAENNKLWIISSPFTNLMTPVKSYCTTCGGKYIVLTPDDYLTSCLRVQANDVKFDRFIIGSFSNNKLNFQKQKIRVLENISVDNSLHCNECDVRYLCGIGCSMRSYLHTGNFLIPDKWECEVKKKLIYWALDRLNLYFKTELFPSLLGQHIFEREVLLKLTQKETLSRLINAKDNISSTNSSLYSLIGTSEEEFIYLNKLSRCECF